MKQGFEIVTPANSFNQLIEYRNKGAIRGVYLGFPLLHEKYTMSLPGVTDWTGYPQSGKSEVLLEMLLNTSLFYGWKHLLYVPDIGDKNEIMSILIHKLSGKTFDKRYVNSNYISEQEVSQHFNWVLHHFRIMVKTDLKAKVTPYEFWEYAAKLNQETEGGIQTATIDSWKDMYHNTNLFGRDDKYLEDVLSYRNSMSELHKMHFHTIIHPKSMSEKDAKGNRRPPKPDDLKGGSEWWNNGKCMITIHRQEGSFNGLDFTVTKAKPKSVASLGTVEMFFDLKLAKFYWDYNGEKKYANEKYFKPTSLQIFDEQMDKTENDDIPF